MTPVSSPWTAGPVGLTGRCMVLDGARPMWGERVGMHLVVDLSTGAVGLRDGDDMGRFSLQVLPGEPGDGDVLVPADAVRRLAGEAAAAQGRSLGDQWESGFAGMLEYAAKKGWTTDDGSIRAHVEWEG
jgi:hypothetical protein